MSENNKDLTTSQEVASKKTEKVQKKDQKPGFFKRVAKWFHELKVEAKKVVWPNKKTVTKNTVVVIIALVVYWGNQDFLTILGEIDFTFLVGKNGFCLCC